MKLFENLSIDNIIEIIKMWQAVRAVFWGTLISGERDHLLQQAMELIDQGLNKHQEVSSTPVTKGKKIIVVLWDLLDEIKRLILKHRFHVVHMNYW